MGCDIHLMAQRKTESGWETAECPRDVADEWIREQHEKRPDDEWYAARIKHAWFNDRYYALFAALAGVRNGFGFAGIPTHQPLVPISEPRGLPDDLLAVAADDHELPDGYWLGDHSHSWLTLREVLDYDWDRELVWPDGSTTPLRECVGDFLTRTVPALRSVGEPDDVRIVFGFDS